MNSDARMPVPIAMIALMVAAMMAAIPGPALSQDAPGAVLQVDDVSPAFLGMYKKLMLIEDEIRGYAEQYNVDFDLARAVCLYESGGNMGLTSIAGARGYFQIIPSTFRSLRVRSNIEGGVKYLSQLLRMFEREDYAVAAYNTGPSRVSRRRPMPLETLQYVFGVGHFRMVLKQHDRSVRFHAQQIELTAVQSGEDWRGIARRLGVPTVELRLHNPFLAARPLRTGAQIAYPRVPRGNLVTVADNAMEYRVRHGDNYLHLAFSLSVGLETLRTTNGLWRLQSVPPDLALRVPLRGEREFTTHTVQPGQTLDTVADAREADPWNIIRDNGLFATEDALLSGTVLYIRVDRKGRQRATGTVRPVAPVSATGTVAHRVERGDTLSDLARLYGTTVAAIQSASGLGRSTLLRIGDTLTIPGSGFEMGPGGTVTHRVERGDTLSGLAARYGTTVAAIQSASGIGRRTLLRIGDTLTIPGSGVDMGASGAVTHRVERGDTLSGLAARYGTTVAAIQNASGIGRQTLLRIGQVLTIPVARTATGS